MQSNNQLQPLEENQKLEELKQKTLELIPNEKKEIGNLIALGLKNFIGSIPMLGVLTTTGYEYYAEKVIEKRFNELQSHVDKINEKFDVLGNKIEAKDYLENSLLFKYEEIVRKLIENPGRGFDELLAEFIAQALTDTQTPPETKDYIVTSLLELDAVDIKVLVTLDKHFRSNLNVPSGAKGVTRDSLVTLLQSQGIDKVLIGRSLQRLQTQYLVRPYSSTTATVQEQPDSQGLYEGKMSPQFDSPGGFLATDYGRKFLQFLKLEN